LRESGQNLLQQDSDRLSTIPQEASQLMPHSHHLPNQEESDGSNTTWMEKVSDEQYSQGPAATQEPLKTQGAKNMNQEPMH
jgi:hypothetical protein